MRSAAVARAFAQEGAKVFLTGSRRAPLEAVVQLPRQQTIGPFFENLLDCWLI